jgi:hypothetical protein
MVWNSEGQQLFLLISTKLSITCTCISLVWWKDWIIIGLVLNDWLHHLFSQNKTKNNRIVVDLHCFTPYFIWITTLHCNLDNKGYTSIGIWQHKNIHHPITYHIIENCRFRSFSMCINQVNIFFINNMRTIFSSKKYIYLISPNIYIQYR